MKTKCLLCTALTEPGQGFYDHLEDVHMMPIRRMRVVQPENWIHGMSLENLSFFLVVLYVYCFQVSLSKCMDKVIGKNAYLFLSRPRCRN